MAMIVLNGITWGHSRGITPLLAYAQRFNELNPEVEVVWKKRTLQEFADFPIEKLTKQYDLLIIDHPWVGCAAATGCVVPLDEYLPTQYLDDQLKNSIGYSHLSYNYKGHQWALAIDAATPVASYRADLLNKHNTALPSKWEDVIALAKQGRVALPAIPIDMLMNFYTFCIANGAEPFQHDDEVISTHTGIAALETMGELYRMLDKKMFTLNPIGVAEIMSKTDEYWYCPFAYGYSNYSREGYAKNILVYTDLVKYKTAGRLRSTIGGTGLAVSAFSAHRELAIRFAAEVVSAACQSTFYVQHGGQPGHKSAWTNQLANLLCNEYFKNVLPAMENGFVRPRYNGYLHFQDHAGDHVRDFVTKNKKPEEVLKDINLLYRKSRETSFNFT